MEVEAEEEAEVEVEPEAEMEVGMEAEPMKAEEPSWRPRGRRPALIEDDETLAAIRLMKLQLVY